MCLLDMRRVGKRTLNDSTNGVKHLTKIQMSFRRLEHGSEGDYNESIARAAFYLSLNEANKFPQGDFCCWFVWVLNRFSHFFQQISSIYTLSYSIRWYYALLFQGCYTFFIDCVGRALCAHVNLGLKNKKQNKNICTNKDTNTKFLGKYSHICLCLLITTLCLALAVYKLICNRLLM